MPPALCYRSSMGAPDTNKAILQRVINEVFNQKQYHVADELYAEDLVVESAAETEGSGPEIIKNACRMYDAAFSDLHYEILNLVADDAQVAVTWRATGRHTGPLMDIAPTGRPFTVDGVAIAQVRDGKIWRLRQVVDFPELTRQLG